MPDGYPDEITQSYGLTVESQITAIENGQDDWTLEAPPADRLNELGTKYATADARRDADGVLVRADERQPRTVQQPQGPAGGQLRDRPNALVKIFGGPKLAVPSCQVLRRASRATRPTARTRRTPARRGRRPTSRRRSSSSRSPAQKGESGRHLPGRRGAEGSRCHLASVLNEIGFKATAKTISGEHRVHLRPEHEEQGADQRPAVVPGLPRCLGLPEHPVRLRVVPPGSDSSINIAGFCDKTINAQMHKALKLEQTELPGREHALGEDRPSGDRPGARWRRYSRRATSTSCRSASGTSRSASSSTGWSTSPGSSSRAPGGSVSGAIVTRPPPRRATSPRPRRPLAARPQAAAAEPHRAGDGRLFVSSSSLCLCAPLYAHHVAHTDPFQLEPRRQDGRRRQARCR